jgi:hypothetical protein
MDTVMEKPTKHISPLLNDKIIERGYMRGVEDQISGQKTEINEPHIETPTPGADQSQQSTGGQGFSSFETPPEGDDTVGFSFEQEVDDASDVTDDDPGSGGFVLDASSSKTFANVIGDIIKIKVPEITYQISKVDIPSIDSHIRSGNIQAGLRDVFINVNENTKETLQFEDEEIKMWKKAFKEFLEYKNIKTANPETAFYIATGTLVLTQTLKTRELSKRNKKMIYDAINSYNPAYFESYKARTNTPPDENDQAATNQSEPQETSTNRQPL